MKGVGQPARRLSPHRGRRADISRRGEPNFSLAPDDSAVSRVYGRTVNSQRREPNETRSNVSGRRSNRRRGTGRQHRRQRTVPGERTFTLYEDATHETTQLVDAPPKSPSPDPGSKRFRLSPGDQLVGVTPVLDKKGGKRIGTRFTARARW
jgi:hypothetical protein